MEPDKKLGRLLTKYINTKSELDYSAHMCYDHGSQAHCELESAKEEEKDFALQEIIDYIGAIIEE